MEPVAVWVIWLLITATGTEPLDVNSFSAPVTFLPDGSSFQGQGSSRASVLGPNSFSQSSVNQFNQDNQAAFASVTRNYDGPLILTNHGGSESFSSSVHSQPFTESFSQPISTSCAKGEIRHVDGRCVIPEVTQHIFLYDLPREQTVTAPLGNVAVPKEEQKIRLISFPTSFYRQPPIFVFPAQENNFIYVIDRKTHEEERKVLNVPTPVVQRPEVYFTDDSVDDIPTFFETVNPRVNSPMELNKHGTEHITGDVTSSRSGHDVNNRLMHSTSSKFVSETLIGANPGQTTKEETALSDDDHNTHKNSPIKNQVEVIKTSSPGATNFEVPLMNYNTNENTHFLENIDLRTSNMDVKGHGAGQIAGDTTSSNYNLDRGSEFTEHIIDNLESEEQFGSNVDPLFSGRPDASHADSNRFVSSTTDGNQASKSPSLVYSVPSTPSMRYKMDQKPTLTENVDLRTISTDAASQRLAVGDTIRDTSHADSNRFVSSTTDGNQASKSPSLAYSVPSMPPMRYKMDQKLTLTENVDLRTISTDAASQRQAVGDIMRDTSGQNFDNEFPGHTIREFSSETLSKDNGGQQLSEGTRLSIGDPNRQNTEHVVSDVINTNSGHVLSNGFTGLPAGELMHTSQTFANISPFVNDGLGSLDGDLNQFISLIAGRQKISDTSILSGIDPDKPMPIHDQDKNPTLLENIDFHTSPMGHTNHATGQPSGNIVGSSLDLEIKDGSIRQTGGEFISEIPISSSIDHSTEGKISSDADFNGHRFSSIIPSEPKVPLLNYNLPQTPLLFENVDVRTISTDVMNQRPGQVLNNG